MTGRPFSGSQQALLDLAMGATSSFAGDDDDDDGEGGGGGGWTTVPARPPGSSGPDDPLAKVDLAAQISELFLRLGGRGGEGPTDVALLTAACAEMTPRQSEAVRSLFEPQGGASGGK